jgi:hypothetical protein
MRMQADKLDEQVDQILEEVDSPSVSICPEQGDPVTEGEFTEPIEGEVIENPPRPKGISLKWLIPVGLASLAVALVGVLVIVPLFAQSATIIITPDRQAVTITATMDTPARTLFTKSLTLSQQVDTTGKAYRPASVATGTVVFYNSLLSPQTVPAGTMLIGADGIHVITDEDANIPAGMLSTNGAMEVPAHTTTTGTGNDIAEGDINGACCRDYVFARNHAFSGGQDAREYPTPTKTDIEKAVTDMTSILQESMSAEAQSQMHPGEAVLPPQCRTQSTSNIAPGSEAAKITVSLISTCSAYAYTKADVTRQEIASFTQAITSQLGSGYGLDTAIGEHVTRIQTQDATVHITVSLSGTAIYHFPDSEMQHMKTLIAGKSRSQAMTLLLSLPGVHTAGMEIAQGRTMLPSDDTRIAIAVYQQ